VLSLKERAAWVPVAGADAGHGFSLARTDEQSALVSVENLRRMLAPDARRALLLAITDLARQRVRPRVAIVSIESSDDLLLAVIVALYLHFKSGNLEITLYADPVRVNTEVYRLFGLAIDKPGQLLKMLDRMMLSRLHHLIGANDHDAIAALAPCLPFLDIIGDGDPRLTRRLAHQLNAQKRNLQFMVTRRCQLRCVYCPAEKRDEDLDVAHALPALELLLRSESDSFRVDFAGGEPLLCKPWVRQVIETAHARARETGKRDSYYLVTNAIELSEDFSRFLADYDLELEISIDGDESSHNKNKVAQEPGLNPYRTLLANFESVRQNGIRYNAVLVFTPASFATLRQDLDHVLSLGFHSVSINYAIGYYWEPEIIRRYVDLLGELVDRYDMAEKGEGAQFFIKNLLYKSEPTVLNSELMVDTDGSLHLLSEWQFKKAFRKNPGTLGYSLKDLTSIDQVYFTKAQVYHLLYEIYRSPDGRTLRIIHNNVDTGLRVAQLLKARLGSAFSEASALRRRTDPGTPGSSRYSV
jgi:uncharacterized Fe-S cluster-containing radical SAM superfamily protein